MTRFSYALRKHPAARFAAVAVIVLVGVLLLFLLTRKVTKKPNVEAIIPSVGSPGEILTVRGDFFGNERTSSYVEFCGNRITESGYVSWKNDEIKITIPVNAEDGLVYVVTRGGKSNPQFFVNGLAIPISAPENKTLTAPVITKVSPETPSIGQTIVIMGKISAARGKTLPFIFLAVNKIHRRRILRI